MSERLFVLATELRDDDRTVHAKTKDGTEIVRYEQTGKWYAEAPDGSRHHIGVNEAARLSRDGFVYFNRPGGRTFERRVRALRVTETQEARHG